MRGKYRQKFALRFVSAQDSGGLSTAEPPGPIPNPEVKRCSADGSIAKGYARVGRCQVINYRPKQLGRFFYVLTEKEVLAISLFDLSSQSNALCTSNAFRRCLTFWV